MTDEPRAVTPAMVADMDYSSLVSLVRERNRPSGGLRTVHTVAVNAFVDRHSRVLEIGCNTGFTAINLSLLTGCQVVGIDLNTTSLAEAERSAAANGVADRVSFRRANATALPFSDRAFDLVWASNVTSFISDKGLAIREYLRMLAPGGFLVLVPIYYRTTPPDTLVRRIGDAIGTSLRVWKKHDWTAFCDAAATDAGDVVELVFSSDFDYVDRTDAIDAYCADVLAKPHLRSLSPEAYTAVVARYKNVIRLFQENLVYCGFSILLYQRRSVREEAELFLSHPISCDD